MAVGYFPFADETDDPFDIYKIILKSKEVEFDEEVYQKTDENFYERDFIKQLLQHMPEKRIMGSFANLQ